MHEHVSLRGRDNVKLKLGCSATETIYTLEPLGEASIAIAPFRQLRTFGTFKDSDVALLITSGWQEDEYFLEIPIVCASENRRLVCACSSESSRLPDVNRNKFSCTGPLMSFDLMYMYNLVRPLLMSFGLI